MEKKYGSDNTNVVRNLLGDIVEDITLFLLHASGIKVISELEQIKLTIAGVTFNGIIDVILDTGNGPEVYDIKSASDYSFKNKFSNGFLKVLEDDVFGYGCQLFGYAHAKDLPVGGWIVINKSTGDIIVVEAPKEQEHLKRQALETIKFNIRNIDSSFKRQFTDIEEVFRKKKTGNRILCNTCSMCVFKHKCWGDVKTRASIPSTSKNAKYVDYTFIKGESNVGQSSTITKND